MLPCRTLGAVQLAFQLTQGRPNCGSRDRRVRLTTGKGRADGGWASIVGFGRGSRGEGIRGHPAVLEIDTRACCPTLRYAWGTLRVGNIGPVQTDTEGGERKGEKVGS